MRRIFTALLCACALTVFSGAAETNILTTEYVDKLRASVRADHPSVAAAQARIRAADANIRAVRLWEDPIAGAAYMAAERMMQEEDGDFMFEVEQTLPRRKLYAA